jgi:hypothetical protein
MVKFFSAIVEAKKRHSLDADLIWVENVAPPLHQDKGTFSFKGIKYNILDELL